MSEDWIARGIALAAAGAAIVNSVISYRKYRLDADANLPEVGWSVRRASARALHITVRLTNDRTHPIVAKGIAIGNPPGAHLDRIDVREEDGPVAASAGAMTPDCRGQAVRDGVTPPGETRTFAWRVIIPDEYPAPYPVATYLIFAVDLGDGRERDHHFKFKRSV